MGRKSKDVTPGENASHVSAKKKLADSLPKILAMARYNGSLQQQWIRCGKVSCKCSRGQLHGPYFYFFISMPSGLSKSYVRRADVSVIHAVISERKRRRSVFQSQLREAHDFLRQRMQAVTR